MARFAIRPRRYKDRLEAVENRLAAALERGQLQLWERN